MPAAIIAQQMQIGGFSMSAANTLTGNAQEGVEDTAVAAEEGDLTTRTDADTGVVTLDATPTMTTADKVNVFWIDAGVRKSRTNMEVTNVSDNAVTIDGGDGDDLPTQDDAIDLAIQTDLRMAFDGDDLVAIAAIATRAATIAFYSGVTRLTVVDIYAGSAWLWQSGQGSTTPITGAAVDNVTVACRDTAGEATVKIGILQDV